MRVEFEKTEAKAEALEVRAATDTLTGLANRFHFESVLEKALRTQPKSTYSLRRSRI